MQKTSVACGQLDKCAWTGEECLGKELVSVCHPDLKAGSSNVKAMLAILLPFFCILPQSL